MTTQGNTPLFDELGHMIWVDREEFRSRVIPENIQGDWDNEEQLYAFVVQLFRDGFLEEAEKGADRLLELSGRSEGALLLKALIHLRRKEYGEAEEILKECIGKYPDRGVAYTYLARVYAGRGEVDRVVPTLKEGLEREPNQETALRLLTRWCSNREHAAELLQSFTKLPGAWWPQLELGKWMLEEQRVEEAMEQFRSAMEQTRTYRGEEGVPEWEEEVAAMTVTAVMRRKGLREELIHFCETYWTPAFITPFTGLDYALALEEAGRIKDAVEVLSRMEPHVQPEYVSMLQMRIHQLEKKAIFLSL